MEAYSFGDVILTINGPSATIIIAGGPTGVADEGITIERAADVNTMLVGCNGEIMQCLKSGKHGVARVRLLQNSPKNGQLMMMYNQQSTFASDWARNNMTLLNKNRGDRITMSEVAFGRLPTLVYATNAMMQEWLFHCGSISAMLPALEGPVIIGT